MTKRWTRSDLLLAGWHNIGGFWCIPMKVYGFTFHEAVKFEKARVEV